MELPYHSHLSRDKKLKKLVEQHGTFKLKKRKNVFIYLCGSIISQQLSTKVAGVIHQRFIDLYNGKEPSPQEVLNTSFEKLRKVGLSNAKVGYVQNSARFAVENGMNLKTFNKLTNTEIIQHLTKIKGVGQWTVEMLMMFALGREDVFSVNDLGIQNAMIGLYGLDKMNKKEFSSQLLRISEKWAPFRTYACLHLWRWKDS